MSKVTIRFIRETLSHEDDVMHCEGETLECESATADRWVRRDAALVLEGAKKEKAASPKKSAAGGKKSAAKKSKSKAAAKKKSKAKSKKK